MKATDHKFTDADDWKILRSRAKGLMPTEIALEYGFKASSVENRLQRYDAYSPWRCSEIVASGFLVKPARKSDSNYVNGPDLVPAMLADRDKRYEALAQLSPAEAHFGDPPPGRSALDQKREREEAARKVSPVAICR